MAAVSRGEKRLPAVIKTLLKSVMPLLLFVSLQSPAYAAADQPRTQPSIALPEKTGPQDPEVKKRDYFTDLELLTHEGKKVRFYTDMLKDKVVLITAYYINCSHACPLQNEVLSKLQKLLGDRFGKSIFFVSVSVDPVNDRWELVNDYAKVWDARSGWTFLTGKKENVDWVAYKLGLYVEKPHDHETRFVLGNVKAGHWLRMPPNSQAEPLALKLLALEEETKKP